MFEVRAPGGAFAAAEVVGLEPERDTADAAAGTALRDALARYGVLCLRLEESLSEETCRAVASMIGPVKDPVGRTRDGAELRYDRDLQVIDAGFVLTDELREKLGKLSFGGDELRPGLFEHFHTDDTYTEEPAAATVLFARELPPSGGGDTSFLDMRAAWELLDPERRRSLEGLRAVHAYNNEEAFPPRPSARGPNEALVEVAHPIVRTHPVSGVPALYFDLDRAKSVTGMPVAEGRALLQSLQDHAEARAPRYDHVWRDHDVLIWDNASVQHRAGGDFPVGEPRRFWRFMIAGKRPF